MLNALFGSSIRVKILSLFLLHPENKNNIPQIARDLKLPANSVRREIDNIIKLGLIVETSNPSIDPTLDETDSQKNDSKTKSKYFEANRNFILYPEIKALFIKAQILSSQKFILNLQRNFQPKLLALTGFFTNYPEAQTDILIVGHIKRPSFLKLISELEKDLGHEINFTILEEKEYMYRREIMDIFIYNIIQGKTITLIDTFTHK